MNSETEQKIRSIADWMIQHIEEQPTVETVREHFGMTDYELKAGFKQVFGLPVAKWFRHRRMKIARLLLEQSDENISFIARSVGYGNSSRFAEAFRSEFGIRPSEHRTRCREGGVSEN